VEGPVQCRRVVCDVKENRMRILCDGSCLDNVKCGTVVYDHRDKLKDTDSDERTICIVAFEAKRRLNDFAWETMMPPKSLERGRNMGIS
jgi:hypothetical protein